MKHSDVEELARKAVGLMEMPIALCGTTDWQRKFRLHFAALVLEKAAEEMRRRGYTAVRDELRAMSAALQSGDRG